jgi:hypothetical protein
MSLRGEMGGDGVEDEVQDELQRRIVVEVATGADGTLEVGEATGGQLLLDIGGDRLARLPDGHAGAPPHPLLRQLPQDETDDEEVHHGPDRALVWMSTPKPLIAAAVSSSWRRKFGPSGGVPQATEASHGWQDSVRQRERPEGGVVLVLAGVSTKTLHARHDDLDELPLGEVTAHFAGAPAGLELAVRDSRWPLGEELTGALHGGSRQDPADLRMQSPVVPPSASRPDRGRSGLRQPSHRRTASARAAAR